MKDQQWRTLSGDFIENIQIGLSKEIEKCYSEGWEVDIAIGSDSQVRKFRKKKERYITYITAMAVHKLTPDQKWDTHEQRRKRTGAGGRCFYIRHSVPLNSISIEQRLINEVAQSVEWAQKIDEIIATYDLCVYDIHLDLNRDKKHISNKVVSQCSGWVKGIGFEPVLKPNAWIASKVADKLTRK